jgi:hypothetical protein
MSISEGTGLRNFSLVGLKESFVFLGEAFFPFGDDVTAFLDFVAMCSPRYLNCWILYPASSAFIQL